MRELLRDKGNDKFVSRGVRKVLPASIAPEID